MAAEVRDAVEPGRHVHLVLEHDGNASEHLRRDFDAQWNDDAHHVLHVLLSGQCDGYYSDYAVAPANMLARCLAQGFAYQGERSTYRQGKPRGSPSGDLAPTAFVLFLQNHDQIGNRPFGDRLVEHADGEALEAAIALQLLCPQIPLIFMGEEGASRTPFLYFTDHHGELAKAVREGRRREFAGFEGFQAGESAEEIPDPNAPQTFERSRPMTDGEQGERRQALYAKLLALRAAALMPQLEGAQAVAAHAAGVAGALARWRLADSSVLTIACNLGREPCPIERPLGRLLFESRSGAGEQALHGRLEGRVTVAFLEPPG